jgi:hypothetical protein
VSSQSTRKASLPSSQADLAAAFEASQAELFDGRMPENLAKITPLQQVTLSIGTDGLTVQASGNDPSVFIPEIPPKEPSIVKVEKQTVYTEANSVVQPVKTGRNVVYLGLNGPDLVGRWRLDPGGVPGTYVIHNLEVRAIPAKAMGQ